MRTSLIWSLLLLGMGAGRLWAQGPGVAVQLPTWSAFSARTTVTVPDGGRALLGGVSRAAAGRNEFGVPALPWRPFRNTGIGGTVSSAAAQVTVTIHDFEAMDRMLLSQPTAVARTIPRQPWPAMAASRVPLARESAPAASWDVSSLVQSAQEAAAEVAKARAERVRHREVRNRQAADFFMRGQQADANGKTDVAVLYYHMAAKLAGGELKQRIERILAAACQREAVVKLTRNNPGRR